MWAGGGGRRPHRKKKVSNPVLKTKPSKKSYMFPEINHTYRDKLQKYQAQCFITS
jgi:hypothetical protein